MDEEKIKTDNNIGAELINLAKEIQNLEFQNKIITGIHMLLILLSLSFILCFWNTYDTRSALGLSLMIISAELIDTLAFKLITDKNKKNKNEAEGKIRQITQKCFGEHQNITIYIDNTGNDK